MSFGISVGDFIAVGQLAWRLYQDCYRIARGAPHEFRLLVDELKTLYTTMKLFEDELKDPNSVLVKAGEERLQMVKDLLEKVKQVLKGLDDSFNKHRKLGDVTRKGLKVMWDQFQWARYAKDVDGLRNKVGAQSSTSGWSEHY
jgi:cell division septal protein FtsQ